MARGKVCNRPVSLIDLYPTLIDLCDLPRDPNAGKSGRRWAAIRCGRCCRIPSTARGTARRWRLSVVPGPPGGPHYSVRSERYRYTLCSNGEEEFYDHAADPNEWTNLAARTDGEYPAVKRNLRKVLTDLVRATEHAEKPHRAAEKHR